MVGSGQRNRSFECLINPNLVRLAPGIIELIQDYDIAMSLRMIVHLTRVEVGRGGTVVLILLAHQRVEKVPFRRQKARPGRRKRGMIQQIVIQGSLEI